MATVIDVAGVEKRFGNVRALQGVTFSVEQGEVFGYLGPNGSGKSTTIRVLLDLLRPDAGSVRVLGEDPRRSGARERGRVGYLPGDLTLWPHMTVRGVLRTLGGLRGLEDDSFALELCERFQLDADRDVGTLSKGNRQKVGVIQAFQHRPELVILDEPSSGLDPIMQREFRDLVREWAAAGNTVLVSSHVMEEVESLAHRVAILNEGVVLAVDTVSALESRERRTLTATLPVAADASHFAGLHGVTVGDVEDAGRRVTLVLAADADLPSALRVLADLDVLDIEAGHPGLATAFMDVIGSASGGGS